MKKHLQNITQKERQARVNEAKADAWLWNNFSIQEDEDECFDKFVEFLEREGITL